MIDLTDQEVKIVQIALDTLLRMSGDVARREHQAFDALAEVLLHEVEERKFVEIDVVGAVFDLRKKIDEQSPPPS